MGFSSILGDDTLIDPVIDEYERHGGSVTCIKCSPLRNLFVSSGTDKEIRIYNLDEVNPRLSHFSLSNHYDSTKARNITSLFTLIEFFIEEFLKLKINASHTIDFIMYKNNFYI